MLDFLNHLHYGYALKTVRGEQYFNGQYFRAFFIRDQCQVSETVFCLNTNSENAKKMKSFN